MKEMHCFPDNRQPYFDITRRFPKVLLVGNGVLQSCRSLDGRRRVNWADSIQKMSGEEMTEKKRQKLKDVPYSVQASVAAPRDDAQRRRKYNECFPTLERIDNMLLRELTGLPFDAILTTNYTYEIEDTFCNGYSARKDKSRYAVSYGEDAKYLLSTCNRFKNSPTIWHIHGELRRKSSIVMTHDEYARLLQKIVSYNANIGGKYELFHGNLRYDSWIDYYLMSDLYIVGLSMDFSEIDLWWLLNRRLRERSKTGKVVFYKAMYDNPSISNALQLMDVEVVEPDIDAENRERYYDLFYKSVTEDIRNRKDD